MNNILFVLLATLSITSFAHMPATEEIRYCGPPPRYEDGSIKRSSAVTTAFKRIHPCPSTGLTSGACPGWQMDHIIPLACGGCDSVNNMQWLPESLKITALTGKDRFERKIYCSPMMVVK